VWNGLGEVRVRAQLGAWIRPGTVSLPKGLWRRHTANGSTATALAPATLTDIAGGACFNDARVQVSRG
jgi:anaerobic selenocysteine-containing dehydrogenase